MKHETSATTPTTWSKLGPKQTTDSATHSNSREPTAAADKLTLHGSRSHHITGDGYDVLVVTRVSPVLAPESGQCSRGNPKGGCEVSDHLAGGLVEELGPVERESDERMRGCGYDQAHGALRLEVLTGANGEEKTRDNDGGGKERGHTPCMS